MFDASRQPRQSEAQKPPDTKAEPTRVGEEQSSVQSLVGARTAASQGAAMPVDGGTQPRGPSSLPPFGVIVEDGAPLGPGQVRRSQALVSLGAEIERVADEELAPSGRTSRDCPYIEYWLGYYRGRSATDIERAIERYARPESRDLSGIRLAMIERVRTGVRAWVQSGGGEVQVPGGVGAIGGSDGVGPTGGSDVTRPTGGFDGTPAAPAPLAIGRSGGGTRIPPSVDLDAVRGQLGGGAPLDADTRVRMERGLGHGFGDVRVHTGATAARLADDLSARAFAVGTDVAFASGEYRPHSPQGDALVAHELAHVMEQRGASQTHGPVPVEASRSPAEHRADAAAWQVMRSMLGAGKSATDALVGHRPARAGALRLQRCGTDEPAPAPPAPSPQAQMRTVLNEVLADNSIAPAEWRRLRERSGALGLAEGDLEDLAHEHAGVERRVARQIAVLATRGGAALDSVRATYTGAFTAGADQLTPPLIPVLLQAALADNLLDFAELDALRTLALNGQLPDFGDLRQALVSANVDTATVDGLMRVVNVSGMAWNSLAADPAALPIRISKNPQAQLTTTSDLRVVLIRALTGDGSWSNLEFPVIRALLQPLGRADATKLLQTSGIADLGAADQLAKQFTAPGAEYGQRMPQEIRFRRDGSNFALVTPLFPAVPASAVPRGSAALKYIGNAQDLGDYTFRTGVTAPADRQIVEIQGRQIPVIREKNPDNYLLRGSGIIMANDGLAPVPAHHLALIRTLVVDPGVRQDAGADAGRDGVVTMYQASTRGGVEAVRMMVHETGHLVSFNADQASPGFWGRWMQAARDDDAAVSVYGTTNQYEDFAEAYLMYIVDRTAMTSRFAHRAAIIAPLVTPAAPAPTHP